MLPFPKWAPDRYRVDSQFAAEALGVLPGSTSKRPWPSLATASAALRTTRDITDITQDDPAVVTYSGSDEFANGESVRISGVVGMTEVNDRDFTVANVDTGANTFELSGEDSTGHTAYDSAGKVADVAAVGRGAFSARTSSGSTVVFAGSATKLYKYAQSAHPSWTDVTRTSGGDYALGDDDFWSFDQFDDEVVACNGVDANQYINVDSGTAFAALGGSPPVAKYCKTVGDVLLLMDLGSAQGSVASTGRIQAMWSGFRDIHYWTLGKKSCGFATFWSGGFVQGCTTLLAGLLFQQRGIQRMVQTTSTQLLAFAPIQEGQGTDSPYSIVSHEGTAYLYSPDGFVAVSGGSVVPIGDEWVDEWFFENCNQTRTNVIKAAFDPIKMRLFWLFPTTGNSATTLDHIIAYDIRLAEWTHANVDASVIFSAAVPGRVLSDIASEYPTLEEVPYPFGSRVWLGGAPGVAAFDADDRMAFFAGPNMEATVQTALFQPVPGRRFYVSGWRPLTDATTVTSRVGVAERPQDMPAFGVAGTMNSSGRVTRRASGRYARIEVSVAAGDNWDHIQGVDFVEDDIQEDGEN